MATTQGAAPYPGYSHMAASTQTQNGNDTTELTANVKVEKKGMSFLQWVGVVGVGSALVMYVIPKLMQQDAANQAFIQGKMFDTAKESAVALSKAADAMDDLADSVGELTDSQQDFLKQLKPLTQQLGEVASAVTEQVEHQKQSEGTAEP